jgi:hypothetical protein
MAVVFELHPTVEETPAAQARSYRRIRAASQGLAALFTLLFAADALLVAALLLAFLVPYTGQHLGIGPTGMLIHSGPQLPAPYVAVDGLPLGQRLAHVPVGLLNAAPVLVMFWSLRQLFGLYGKGVVFARENAILIKWIGAGLVAHAAAPGLGVLFLSAVHQVIDHRWMHAASLQELVLGGIVYVIAEVMQVGRELEEERSQFV